MARWMPHKDFPENGIQVILTNAKPHEQHLHLKYDFGGERFHGIDE